MIVLSSPFKKAATDVISTTEIITADQIANQANKPIGDVLSGLPGVSSAGYGPAVGQPIIRGLGGYRVDVMQNGMSIGDIVGTGGDHANALKLFDTERIEVLKGPAALRYGAFAATGVVNSFNRHLDADAETNADILLDFGDNADETITAFHTRRNGFAISGYAHDADNITIPTHAESDHQIALECEENQEQNPPVDCEPHPSHEEGEGKNTQNEGRGFSVSGHFGDDKTKLAVLLSSTEMDYGVPGHAHDGEEAAKIDLEQQTIHARLRQQLSRGGMLDSLQTGLTVTELEQDEYEDGAVETTFEQSSLNLRSEAAGVWGDWKTLAGLEYRENELTTKSGDEHAHGYVPDTERSQYGVFAFAERERNGWLTELGLRFDSVEQDSFHDADEADENASVSQDLTNISAGLARKLDGNLLVGGSLSSTERAPSQVELFAEGEHHAVERFEKGDKDLNKETSLSTELYIRKSWGNSQLRVAVFQNDYSDFIYMKHGECADIREEQSECANVDEHMQHIEYMQQDAELNGYELEYKTSFGAVDTTLSYGAIEGELADGGNLPSIPPEKIGVSFVTNVGPTMVSLDIENVADQKDVALNDPSEEHDDELATDGFTSVDISAKWQPAQYEGLTLSAGIRNATDEEIRHHTSPLKDLMPEAGQDIRFSARYKF